MKPHRDLLAAGSVVLFLSLSCIAWNVWRVACGTRAMWGRGFWICVLFHTSTAVAAMVLLDRAWRRGASSSTEDRS